jgi:hypothetical protein
LEIGTTGSLTFEGSTADAFETTLAVVDPTADRTITLPNVTGTVVTTGDSGTVTSTMIADGTIVDGDVSATAAIAGTKVAPDFGSQNVTTTGTATAASLTPTGSSVPTNGVYLPAANSVAISTNGVQRINIEADGDINIDSGGVFYDATNNRLAIGTASPSEELHVVGDSLATGYFRVLATNEGGLFDTGGQTGWTLAGSSNASPNILRGYTAGSERLRVDASGRLLVGTSTASTVGGYTASIQAEGTDGDKASLALIRNSNSAGGHGISLGKSRGTAVGSKTVVADGDFLGSIIFNGADGTNYITAGQIDCRVDGTPGANDMPGRLVFSTTADAASSPTERMRITNAGEVLIGTTTPVLSAAGLSTGVTAAFASGLRLQDGGGVGWSGNPTIRNNNGSGYLICMNGTTGGVGLLNGGTSWTSLSDENYKTNLKPITEASAKIRSLRSVTGRYIDDDESISRSFLIAQDVEAVLPEAVSTAENGKKLLSYTDTIPLLTAALKEALEKIETLEAKVAALEAS